MSAFTSCVPSIFRLPPLCRQWVASVHSCPTCLTPSLPGSACWRLEGCGHVFCAQCVTSHVAARLADGDVAASGSGGSGGGGSGSGGGRGMACPECCAPLSQGDVRAALGGHADERYARYESLLLTATLESLARAEAAAAGSAGGISGMVYCPRPWCSKPAVPFPASAGTVAAPRPRHASGSRSSDAYTIISPLAQCPYCDFMFCLVSQRQQPAARPHSTSASGASEIGLPGASWHGGYAIEEGATVLLPL